MRFYLNEASVQGQFDDSDQFRNELSALLKARSKTPYLRAMRTTPALAEQRVTHGQTVREVVQAWRGSALAGAFLAWVGSKGPFIDDDRLEEAEDLFHCLGVEVTDGGLGEAGRRVKADQRASAFSFAKGTPEFGISPLTVVHGFEDEPISEYKITNFWDAEAMLQATHTLDKPATSWREMVEVSRRRYPKLTLPDTVWQDRRLAKEPFDAILRDRAYVLLGHLNEYMTHRTPIGSESVQSREIIQSHFNGDRALFSGESASNRRDFKTALTFTDPSGGDDIFAHWHGKISHRHYRVHFEWPVPATATQLKVLYIGPKLTKS